MLLRQSIGINSGRWSRHAARGEWRVMEGCKECKVSERQGASHTANGGRGAGTARAPAASMVTRPAQAARVRA
jgi:hypothetical protein